MYRVLISQSLHEFLRRSNSRQNPLTSCTRPSDYTVVEEYYGTSLCNVIYHLFLLLRVTRVPVLGFGPG